MFFNKLVPCSIYLSNYHLFHTTQHNLAIARFMKKIINGKKSKKRVYYDDSPQPTSSTFTKDILKKTNPENTRRLAVLNKLFMRHITDLMTTGEYATLFTGYGLEINKVKVTPDYHGINVYWIAREDKGNEIDKLLENKGNQLRHELTQLHIVGIVPKIKFIKDKEYARIVEVDSRLAHADFGEDHELSEPNIRLQSYLKLNKSLNQNVKDKILALEEVPEDTEAPPMPQDVLGLNHSEVMDRIKRAMKKSQASHRNETIMQVNESVQRSLNSMGSELEVIKSQREIFQKFLAERQIVRNKMRRNQEKCKPDWDYQAEKLEIAKQQQLSLIDMDDQDNDDYIDEDNDMNKDDYSKI